jgi:hypothetical protein
VSLAAEIAALARSLVAPAVFGATVGLAGVWRAQELGVLNDGRASAAGLGLAAGAFLGALVAFWAAEWLVGRPGPAALAAGVAAVPLTGAAQGAIFGLHFYANAYAELSSPVETPFHAFMQLASTSAQGAIYFGIFGLRVLWPYGLAALALFVALAFATLRRPE